MAASRIQNETGTVVNTKFGARPIIDLPAFAFGGSSVNVNSNLADVQPRMFGPKEYTYNVGKNVPRDHSNGGYIGQYYNIPSHSSPDAYQNPNSNFVKESNVIPYPSYTTVPNMASQQPRTQAPYPNMAPQPNAQGQYSNMPSQLPPAQVSFPSYTTNPNMASQQPPSLPVAQYQTVVPNQNRQIPYNETNQQETQGKEVHLYYGPNGERLPGPPSSTFMLQRPISKQNPLNINFKIDAKLEYGKMVSIKIKEGNVSFRDIPDFVISDCRKTYGMVPRTSVTIVAERGEYSIYATPDLYSHPLDRLMENIYDPYIRENYRRRIPETDFYTKKYNDDYLVENSFGRRHTVHSDRARIKEPKQTAKRHWYSSDNNRNITHTVHTDYARAHEPRQTAKRHWNSSDDNRNISHTVRTDHARVQELRQTDNRHWYSSYNNRVPYTENDFVQNTRDPQRKPLPMKPMHIKTP